MDGAAAHHSLGIQRCPSRPACSVIGTTFTVALLVGCSDEAFSLGFIAGMVDLLLMAGFPMA
jgi:hypothetical protein